MPEEKLAWAADSVPERAAAPKAVTVLDALPVTDVGKPYKLALRADATRRAITEALASFDGVAVDAVIADGTVIATVTIPSIVDEPKVMATRGRYAVSLRLSSAPS
ncbi:hypothetical protein [Amycolatopsis sp. CA-126428]|uniref:hypothetical protein n=1 Tax=Amycolatopsis sp. CA-126428 TaxID=2073158 RepID=UPI000CD311BB|nr:hypothetical protein [Amycolatopsis sp. CA-126428]